MPDVPANSLTTAEFEGFGGSLQSGSYNGFVESPSDRDWIRVQLNEAVIYRLFAAGETNIGLRVYDQAGNQLALDDDSGAGVNPYLLFMPSSTGIFYIEIVNQSAMSTGAYTVFVTTSNGGVQILNPTSDNYTSGFMESVGAGAGDDTINLAPQGGSDAAGEQGDDFVIGGVASNDISGGLGNDTLRGFDGEDRLWGDFGNDSLDGGISADDLFGGEGNDTLEGGVGDDELSGGAGADLMSGGNDKDTLLGGSGNDTMNGGGDNDILNGLDGVDSMTGGGGDDFFYVDSALDLVFEDIGFGLADRVYAGVSYTLAAGQEIEILTTTSNGGTAAINFTGNAFAQTINGNAGVNILRGGGGRDTLVGLAGNDLYFVDSADDLVSETVGNGTADRVLTSVTYALTAGREIEIFTTDNAAATTALNLTGNSFAQSISGNAGANIIRGGGGRDTMNGFSGNDLFFVDSADDVVVETANNGSADRVLASLSYGLGSGVQVEILTTTDAGGTGAINLTGNEFGQSVSGNAGANVINGRGGIDILNGLGGADRFVFNTALGSANVDTIGDFNVAQDTINLEAGIFLGLPLGTLAAGALAIGTAATQADDRIIYNATTGALFFDRDGVGGVVRVQFARVTAGLGLTNADFVVV